MIVARFLKPAVCLALLGSLIFAAPVLAAYGVDFVAPDKGAVTELGILESFHCTLTNTGDQADTYTITIQKNIPGNWVASLCEGETCYPPFVTQITVDLEASEETQIDVDITPNLDAGYGSCTVTVMSQGNPGLRPSHNFNVVSTGLEALLVVDDTHSNLTGYYTDALDATGKSYGVWKRVEMGTLGGLELENFTYVVWSAGELVDALNADDFSALHYYVQHGGNLFLSGRDLAYENCDPGSPYYSASSHSFFNMILGVDYTGAVSSSFAHARRSGNCPVTVDLSFGLSGGDGANNTHLTLDGIATTGSGLASLEYFDGPTTPALAAIKSSYGDGRTYFAGFAYEAIDNAASRNLLMQRVLGWFDGEINSVRDDIISVLMPTPARAVPNPFNPQTSIKFAVGGDRDVPAQVLIYNIKGQLVRQLFDGSVAPGPQDLRWDGRNDDGRALSTGVYLARITLDGQVAGSTKMTLTK
jgi:hypothetical protein